MIFEVIVSIAHGSSASIRLGRYKALLAIATRPAPPDKSFVSKWALSAKPTPSSNSKLSLISMRSFSCVFLAICAGTNTFSKAVIVFKESNDWKTKAEFYCVSDFQ